jgi:pyruvate formate lyase activating enzyme
VGELDAVLDTLKYLHHETSCWLEITTLLIPGLNDSDDELARLSTWIATELSPEVPLHFSAFHPDYQMRDRPPTPPATLTRARDIARRNGLKFVYTGNVHDRAGGSTHCAKCDQVLIVRDWYQLCDWQLRDDGTCPNCGTALPGVFDGPPGNWGARRQAVSIQA